MSDPSTANATHYIHEKNKSSPVVVYSKTTCSLSDTVLTLLASLTPTFPCAIVALDTLPPSAPTASALQEAFLALTKSITTPHVFIGGAFVGGCAEVVSSHASGELATRIAAATAAAARDEADLFVDEKIAAAPVVVWAKKGCRFCGDVLTRLAGIEPRFACEVVMVDGRPEVREEVVRRTKCFTVPQVYVGGVFVGSGKEVAEKHESGELARLIAAAVEGRGRAADAVEAGPARDSSVERAVQEGCEGGGDDDKKGLKRSCNETTAGAAGSA